MGVVNVTPDSFSDGGDHADTENAIAHSFRLAADGADILDIGGESTRPGAAPVSIDEELSRILPVIEALADAGLTVSVDTRHAAVMTAALSAGASIVNDVTALTGDADSMGVVAEKDVPVILMHMQGEPGTMQDNPSYADAAMDVRQYLSARIDACVAAGIDKERIAIDPGIGFGKTLEHNLDILGRLHLLSELDCSVVLGVSRKSFIGKITDVKDPKQRLGGSLAAALAGIDQGANILRVHDVAETVQALAVWDALTKTNEQQ
ncbi:MAG: dihydropteroate synthase [Rhodospirillaceae bacterium]|nr:dihydropteroate synthase [Rhodospirillaceae bacterium]